MGVELNAENGADFATFIEQLPAGLKETAKKFAGSVTGMLKPEPKK